MHTRFLLQAFLFSHTDILWQKDINISSSIGGLAVILKISKINLFNGILLMMVISGSMAILKLRISICHNEMHQTDTHVVTDLNRLLWWITFSWCQTLSFLFFARMPCNDVIFAFLLFIYFSKVQQNRMKGFSFCRVSKHLNFQ